MPTRGGAKSKKVDLLRYFRKIDLENCVPTIEFRSLSCQVILLMKSDPTPLFIMVTFKGGGPRQIFLEDQI